MSAALEETPISYEDLADIEREFDDAETEIIRQQVALTAPLYSRRTKTVSQIPNFWPLVLEQAPPDIDQYIQPSDSALLLSSLLSFSVDHFEINPNKSKNSAFGDPRSVSIRFEFSQNEYFENAVLEKKFWYRRSRDGWSGLVSEPIRIQWKKDRDLTGGLLDMVCNVWDVEQRSSNGTDATQRELTLEQKSLKKTIENTGMGGLSFFAWFGFIGRKVSAEESAEAIAKDVEIRKNRKANKASPPESIDGDADEGEEDLDMSLEIFPDGDELAIAFTEDLWPSAIKYFTQAQEQDAISDADFESDEGEPDDFNDPPQDSADSDDDEIDARPTKKQRAA
ncbi:hypothetical protein G7Y89_g11804 [Cudoniella acicularis]|uniref:Nap family protein n=1 Tax=Cudoniella acicularis TaxID=354080 RepID=A0A8H4RBP6_9HELO|nr:hypothetical protein G7Y89_g11804 [Cudoniella acicularis]